MMKSPLCTLFFLCATFALLAQNKGKWQGGAIVSPAFSTFSYNKDSYNDNFQLRLFLSGGLKARYFLQERLVLSAGVVYLSHGSGYEVPYGGPNLPEGTGVTEEGVYRVNSVGVPVGVNWLFKNDEKVRLSLGLEVMNAYTIKEELELTSVPEGSPGQLTELEDFDKHFLAVSPNLGIAFQLSERLVLLASPVFNFEVIPNKVADVKSRMLGFGSEFGLYLNL
ncbi:MAG: hypothetical protein AAFZ15_16255 [Bacteroidota bacterium]